MPTVRKSKQPVNWAATYAYKEYPIVQGMRKQVEDCLQGQHHIKMKGGEYLPRTQWFMEHEKEYIAYVRRATFYGKTAYAMRVYEGLVTAGEPQIRLPEDGRMDFLRMYATVYKRDLHSLQVRLNRDQFATGLRVMLAEPTDDKDIPFVIKEYGAGSFLRAHFISVGGESVCKFVLMDESHMEFDMDTKQETFVEQLMVFGLDARMRYYQCRMSPADWGKFDIDDPNPPDSDLLIYPRHDGRLFNRIPMTWCGASSLSGCSLDIPILLDMSDLDLKLYNLDANYAQHLYQSSQETVFYTDTPKDFALDKIRYGSGAHNALPPGVDVKVVSVNGIGFSEQREYMNAVKAEMSQRVMSVMSSKSHQSGASVGIVQNAQTSPIRTVVETSGDAITEQLRIIAKWMGYSPEEIAKVGYSPSNEFAKVDTDITSFVALCKAVQEGSVPMLLEDLYLFAKMCGYVNSRMDFDEFKRKHKLDMQEREDDLAVMPKGHNRDTQDNQ